MNPGDPWHPQRDSVRPFPGVSIRDSIAAMIYAGYMSSSDPDVGCQSYRQARARADGLCAELASYPPDWYKAETDLREQE